MTKTEILLFCENTQEVDSLVPVGQALESSYSGSISCTFTSPDPIYKMDVRNELETYGVDYVELSFPRTLDKPYMFAPLYQKLKVLLTSPSRLGTDLAGFDAFICGTDSLPARMLIQEAKRTDLPTYQVYPSLYPSIPEVPSSGLGRLATAGKNAVKRLLSLSPSHRFLAYQSHPGGSDCNRVFVMGGQIKESFVEFGVSADKVNITGNPRFARLFELSPPTPKFDENRTIVHFTAAFKSHGYHDRHRLHQRQLQLLVSTAESLEEDYEIRIKLHPREDQHDYEWVTGSDGVTLVSPDTDPYTEITESALVTVVTSTLA